MGQSDPQARIRELEDQVEVLKDALSERTVMLPAEWRLSPKESEVFRTLLKRDVVRFAAIMAALYSDRPDPPDDDILSAFVFKMRRKLRPFGIEIIRVRGVGYSLDNLTRSRFKEKIAA